MRALLAGLAIWLGLAGLLATAGSSVASAPAPSVLVIDPVNSQLGFEIRTRYGQRLEGRFPVFQGQVLVLPDGQHQVVLALDAAAAEVTGHPRYTRWLRGEDFFDAGQHRHISFRSEPYPATLGTAGGVVAGQLTLRGVPGQLEMVVEPAGCPLPGYDCAVSGRGTVSRSAYGMDGWQFAVSDRVTFVLHVRLTGAPFP